MNFRKLILAIGLFPLGLSAQEHAFNIEGHIKEAKAGAKVFLAYSSPGRMVLDSCAVIDGKFEFKGNILGNKKAFLQMLHEDKGTRMPHEITDAIGVFLEDGIVKVEAVDSLKYAFVQGTPFNNLDQQLRTALAPYLKKEQEMERDFANAKKENNIAKQNEIQSAYLAMDAIRKGVVDKFIEQNKNSYVSFSALRTYVDPGADADRAIRLFDQLNEEIRRGKEGRIYDNMLTNARNIGIGAVAPDFSLPNPEGKEIALSSLKGKYVLIDFWASWCVPCRSENPNVVKAFNTYKDKGFTILGVSLDGGNQAKEKWLQAVKMDHLSWDQVSDLKGWQSEVARKYNVSSIPTNFLIDPRGHIVAKNLRGEMLEKKLAELL